MAKGHKTGGRRAGTPNKATSEIKALAQRHGRDALKRIVELSKSEDERVSLGACQEILNRAYGKSPQPQTGEDGKGPIKLEVSWAASSG